MNYIVKFAKPVKFEGKEYTQIDLSGLDDLSTRDICELQKRHAALGIVAPVIEMDCTYAQLVAAKVTNLPVEFFYSLPAREGGKVKQAVQQYFLNPDDETAES